MGESSQKNDSKKSGGFGFIWCLFGLVAFISVCEYNKAKGNLNVNDTSMLEDTNDFENLNEDSFFSNDYDYDDVTDNFNDNNEMEIDYTDKNDNLNNSDDVIFDNVLNDDLLCTDVVVTTSDLNFRSDHDINSDIILTFSGNTELNVSKKTSDGWFLVNYNGMSGYVYGDYTISLLEKANLQYPWLDLKKFEIKKMIYSTTDLNIRLGYDTSYDSIGKLDYCNTAKVIEEYGDWYFIMTKDYNFGFINKNYTSQINGSFVEVDLSDQYLFLYNNNKIIYTIPVTTGKDSTPTDIGSFSIYSKEKNRDLVGEDYCVFVNYWMPYNGDEGLHDADWHNLFGTSGYKELGSHGCVNLPPSAAGNVYNNVNVGTKVLVHK